MHHAVFQGAGPSCNWVVSPVSKAVSVEVLLVPPLARCSSMVEDVMEVAAGPLLCLDSSTQVLNPALVPWVEAPEAAVPLFPLCRGVVLEVAALLATAFCWEVVQVAVLVGA